MKIVLSQDDDRDDGVDTNKYGTDITLDKVIQEYVDNYMQDNEGHITQDEAM